MPRELFRAESDTPFDHDDGESKFHFDVEFFEPPRELCRWPGANARGKDELFRRLGLLVIFEFTDPLQDLTVVLEREPVHRRRPLAGDAVDQRPGFHYEPQ